jgi:hypothetical protein
MCLFYQGLPSMTPRWSQPRRTTLMGRWRVVTGRFEEAWRRRGGCIWFVRQAGDNEMARVRELAPHWGLVRGNKP